MHVMHTLIRALSIISAILSLTNLLCCHSQACIYNETYIEVTITDTDYAHLSGVYNRRVDIGLIVAEEIGGSLCGYVGGTGEYAGTYVYSLHGADPEKFLYQFWRTGDGNRLIIGDAYCAQSGVQTNPGASSAVLDGTDCEWALVDNDNAIQWYTSETHTTPVNVTLCDLAEGCLTGTPTSAPTAPTTPSPTQAPTTAEPSASPTTPTTQPTTLPTKTPTVKPTQLPTEASPFFLDPPCVAMHVVNLDAAYPELLQEVERFNELEYYYNERRVWSNGHVEIYFSERFGLARWVISNGTYHMFTDSNQLVNGGTNYSFPGAGSSGDGHALFDHFPNDNVFLEPDYQITLRFVCQDTSPAATRFPTLEPTLAPTSAPSQPPTATPSAAPTESPVIQVCQTLHLLVRREANISFTGGIIGSTCPPELQAVFPERPVVEEEFALQAELVNGHSFWRRAPQEDLTSLSPQEKNLLGWNLYYNELVHAWIIDFFVLDDFQGLVYSAPPSSAKPPNQQDVVYNWTFVPHDDSGSLAQTCVIPLEFRCRATKVATPSPIQNEPTSSPTAAPSFSPSSAPTNAPTFSPSAAPSVSPTFSPTFAPTLLCGGLALSIHSEVANPDYAFFEGTYRRQSEDDLRADNFHWQSREHHGSQLFYSPVTFHESWVVYSSTLETYWLFLDYQPAVHGLQPPLNGTWEYYTQGSFALDRATLTFNCSYEVYPTRAPTATPTGAPTFSPTAAPTFSPSAAPTRIPTDAPTDIPTATPTTASPTAAPTDAPTLSPTKAPTRETCPFVQVYGVDIAWINGVYSLYPQLVNGFSAWTAEVGTSTYIIHKSPSGGYWVINRDSDFDVRDAGDLVSMDNNFNWRPPEFGQWQFWQTRPNPSPAPTFSPSAAPSGVTQPPTSSPTLSPTIDPSVDPTQEPTLGPTAFPTQEPTLEPTSTPSQTPTTAPSLEPTLEPTMMPAVTRRRRLRGRDLLQAPDPPQGTQVFGDRYPISMDCTLSDAPTLAPTTSEPTMAPTSTCQSVLIEEVMDASENGNLTVIVDGGGDGDGEDGGSDGAEFMYGGRYRRQHAYTLNDLPWFMSDDARSSLLFTDGHWSVMRLDQDDGDDEDVIAIYRNETEPYPLKWLFESPGVTTWYLIADEQEIVLDVRCVDTEPPSPAPTVSPTASPTTRVPPEFVECIGNWFTFVTAADVDANNTETDGDDSDVGVYWRVPQAVGEDTGRVSVSQYSVEGALVDANDTSTQLQPGALLEPGVYSIVYRATNALTEDGLRLNVSALWVDCALSLYVIGDAYLNTLEYCLREKQSVEIEFNESFSEVANTNLDFSVDYVFDAELKIEGRAFVAQLEAFEDNCYVHATQWLNASLLVEPVSDARTVLGIEAGAFVWEILVLAFALCVLCLCGWYVLRGCRACYARKQAREADKEAALLDQLENQGFEFGDANVQKTASTTSLHDDDDVDVADLAPTHLAAGGETGWQSKPSRVPDQEPDDQEDDGGLLSAAPGQQARAAVQRTQFAEKVSSLSHASEGNDVDEIIRQQSGPIATNAGGVNAEHDPDDNVLNVLIGQAFEDGDAAGDGDKGTNPQPPPPSMSQVEMQSMSKHKPQPSRAIPDGGDLPMLPNDDDEESPESAPGGGLPPVAFAAQPPDTVANEDDVDDDDDDFGDEEFEFRV